MSKHTHYTPARGCLAKTHAQRMNVLCAMTVKALIEQAKAQSSLTRECEQVSVAMGELPGTVKEFAAAIMLHHA
jgi:hypothetical protein